MNTDFFIVTYIDDGFSSRRFVIGYENNEELGLFFVANKDTLEG